MFYEALMRTTAVISMLLLGVLTTVNASAKENELVFASDFEGNRLSQPWSWIMGCQFEGAEPHSGESALLCAEGNSSIVSKYPISEAGLLEFWVKNPKYSNPVSNQCINLTSIKARCPVAACCLNRYHSGCERVFSTQSLYRRSEPPVYSPRHWVH